MDDFFLGGFAIGSTMADLVKEGILRLCGELKPEAVGIADSLAPPDFILNSIIGRSDGKVSKFYCIILTLAEIVELKKHVGCKLSQF